VVKACLALFFALLVAPLAAAQASSEPVLEVNVTLDRAQVFLHEQAVLSVLVHHPPDARASWEPPPFDGFWAERLGTRGLPNAANGQHRTEFRRALFPTRAGDVEIAASKLVLVGEGGSEREVAVPGTHLRVIPLPAETPANSLVGRLEVSVLPGDDRLRLGKALPLTIELSGDGNVWDAEPPVLEPLLGRDVEVFPEAPRVSIGESGGRATTRRTFRYALVPARTGRLEIGPVRFPYFDPSTSTLASAESEAKSVTVFAGSAEPEARAPWEERSTLREAPPIPYLWIGLGIVGIVGIVVGWVTCARQSGRTEAHLHGAPPPSPRAAFEAALAARDTVGCLPMLASAVRAGIHARHRLDALALTTEEIAARISDREALDLLAALDRARFARLGLADDTLIERVRAFLAL